MCHWGFPFGFFSLSIDSCFLLSYQLFPIFVLVSAFFSHIFSCTLCLFTVLSIFSQFPVSFVSSSCSLFVLLVVSFFFSISFVGVVLLATFFFLFFLLLLRGFTLLLVCTFSISVSSVLLFSVCFLESLSILFLLISNLFICAGSTCLLFPYSTFCLSSKSPLSITRSHFSPCLFCVCISDVVSCFCLL